MYLEEASSCSKLVPCAEASTRKPVTSNIAVHLRPDHSAPTASVAMDADLCLNLCNENSENKKGIISSYIKESGVTQMHALIKFYI